MPTEVIEQQFFHINRSLHYSPYPPMTAGQTIDTAANNPFFQYYDTHVPQHAVTMEDQSVIHLGVIKFLRAVRDGQVNPNNLPVAAHEGAEHFMLLARELLFENIRLQKYPNKPSRLRSLWLVSDLTELRYWNERLARGQQGVSLQFVQVIATGKITRCDASILVGDSERVSESLLKADRYWSGSMAETGAEPEVLFEGTATVSRILDPSELTSA